MITWTCWVARSEIVLFKIGIFLVLRRKRLARVVSLVVLDGAVEHEKRASQTNALLMSFWTNVCARARRRPRRGIVSLSRLNGCGSVGSAPQLVDARFEIARLTAYVDPSIAHPQAAAAPLRERQRCTVPEGVAVCLGGGCRYPGRPRPSRQ